MIPRLVWARLRANAHRHLASVLAIAVAVGFVVASVGLVATLTASVADAIGSRYAGTDVVVSRLGDRTGATEQAELARAARQEARALDIITATPGVRAVTIDRVGYVSLRRDDAAARGTTVSVLAADPGLRWQRLAEGRIADAPGEVVVPLGEGLRIGDEVRVLAGRSAESTPLRVVGTVDLTGQPDLRTSLPLFVTPPQLEQWFPDGVGGDIRVAGAPGTDADDLAEHLRTRLDEAGPESVGAPRVVTGGAAATAIVNTFIGDRNVLVGVLYAFTAIAPAVAAFVVATTLAVVFGARVHEYALLRTLGATRRQVGASALGEAAVTGAVGSALGLVAGWLLITAALWVAPRIGVDLPLGQVRIPAWTWATAFGIGTATTIVVALAPAWRASRTSPLAALRPVDVRPVRWWRTVVLVVVGAAVATGGWAGLHAAVRAGRVAAAAPAGIGCAAGILLILGGAAGFVAGTIGKPIGPLFGPIGRLAARYAARSPARTGATAVALAVGIGLVSTLVVGHAAIGPAVDRRMVASTPLDVVITGRQGILPEDLADRAARIPQVTLARSVPVVRIGDEVGGHAVARVVDAPTVAALMRRPVRAPQPGEIVLPASATVTVDAADGERVRLVFPGGATRELTVRRTTDRWTLLDPGDVPPEPPRPPLPGGGDRPAAAPIPPQYLPRSELWLRMADDHLSARVRDGLTDLRRTVTEAAPEAAVTEAYRSRDQVRDLAERAWTATRLLLAVSVFIALVGVVNTAGLTVTERRRELALLRRVGLTRGGLRSMILIEAGLVGIVAAVVGGGMGLLLGRAGAAVVVGTETVAAAPVPWVELGAIAAAGSGAALCAALIASVGAVRRAHPGD